MTHTAGAGRRAGQSAAPREKGPARAPVLRAGRCARARARRQLPPCPRARPGTARSACATGERSFVR